MEIKVVCSGYANCQKVEALARKVTATLAVDANIEKPTDMQAIMKYPILATTGLVVNEKVMSAVRIPSEAEVTTWVANALL